MQFQIFFLRDLDDEFEDLEGEVVEATSWQNVLQIGELMAIQKKKNLVTLERLS